MGLCCHGSRGRGWTCNPPRKYGAQGRLGNAPEGANGLFCLGLLAAKVCHDFLELIYIDVANVLHKVVELFNWVPITAARFDVPFNVGW